MTRYLVIETAYLGDVIISLAVARAIKQQEADAHVVYLVRPDAAELANACPDVDRVVTFDKRGTESGTSGIRRKASELTAMQFDVLVVLHESRRTRLLVEQIPASQKIGFKGRVEDVLTQSVADSGWTSRYERVLLPVRALFGEEISVSTLPRIQVTPEPRVDAFLAQHPNAICIAPGSAWATKRWPISRFVELASSIARTEQAVIVIGGPDDSRLGAAIYDAVTEAGGHALDLTGKSTLLESAYAISRSTALVGNDSSPVHMAVAVGTPAVAIFGPTVPEFGFAPPAGSGIVVQHSVWCRPCTSHGSHECPIHTHECLKGVGVEEVRAAIERLLAAKRPA